MPSPLTTARNDYLSNPKDNTIETPPGLCQFVYELIADSGLPTEITVLDPAMGKGNLLSPFSSRLYRKVGFDVVDDPDRIEVDEFHVLDFVLEAKPRDDIGLVVCNPPFNRSPEGRLKYGKVLLPEVFAKQVFDLYGHHTPMVLFTPMGFLCNQRIGSARRLSFQDEYADCEITGIASPPLDVFPGVEFHNLILFWNLPGVPVHSWIPEPYLRKKEARG